jgi:hypothetical protein
MKQLFLLDLHDVARLKRGEPLIMQLPGGQSIEIGYDGKPAADLPAAPTWAGTVTPHNRR